MNKIKVEINIYYLLIKIYIMSNYQHLYNKYTQNQNMHVSFNEILKDFSELKPTFNPILDICIIKTLGTYIYNLSNFQKWKICPNIIDEIISMNNSLYSHYNLKNQDIIDIIKKAFNKNEVPSNTINKVYYFVSDSIKENLNMNISGDVTKYFEMKSTYNDSLDKIKLKYQDEWNNIEQQYNIIGDALVQNFNELENDLNFERTTEIIDSIGNQASIEVNKIINNTAILIKENPTLSSQIKIDFDKKIDEIYERVIKSQNFEKSIHDVILDMYGVEKTMHRMSLSLECCSNLLKSI